MADNNIIAFDTKAKLPKGLSKDQVNLDNDDLSQGATMGFPVLGFRGSKFRVKVKGEEIVVKNKDGDAVSSLKVVILRSNPHISKSYYEKAYVEGSNDEPDCYSLDGVKPDANSPKKQCATCAACPQNAFGSRITEQGKKAKACSDVRRVAVVPAGDIKNEAFGGAMLLRIPPASLKNLAGYAQKLKAVGWPYYAVVTKLSFDENTAYPLLTFTAVEPLDDDQYEEVVAMRDDEQVQTILQTAAADASAGAAPEEDDSVAALKDKPKPGKKAKAEEPEEEEEVEEPEEEEEEEEEEAPEPPKKAKKTKAKEAEEEAPASEDDIEAALGSLLGS